MMIIHNVEFLIENGCGREMIKAGLVKLPEEIASPRQETMEFTELGFRFVSDMFTPKRLIDLGILEP